MKRTLFRSLLLVLCICMLPVFALAESWVCEACGVTNTMNFCGNCGVERPKWTCAKCGTQNVGNGCTSCDLSHDASEILKKFNITMQIHIAPILKNDKVDGAILEIDAADTVYMGNYSLNALFLPAIEIENKTDESQTCSMTMEIAGETARWSMRTFESKQRRSFHANNTPLMPGNYDYKFYIDGILVASGQYKLVEETSFIKPRSYSVDAVLRIHDYKRDAVILVGTDTVDVNSLKSNQVYEPYLIVHNESGFSSLHIHDGAVGAILNNEVTCIWKEADVKPNDSYRFYWKNCPLKQGKNEVIWFIDGQEVARDTFTIIGDPSEMGK